MTQEAKERAEAAFIKNIKNIYPKWDEFESSKQIKMLRELFNKTVNNNARWLIINTIKNRDQDHQTGDLADEINNDCEIKYYEALENEDQISVFKLRKIYEDTGFKNDLRELILKSIFEYSPGRKLKWQCFRESKSYKNKSYFLEILIQDFTENIVFDQLKKYQKFQLLIMNFYLQKFEIRGFIKRLFRIENWEEFFPTSLHEILLKLNESDTFFTESKIILINKYISDKRNPKVHFIFKKIFGEESDSSILDTLSVAESKNSIFQKEIFKINREIQDTSSLSGKILLGKNYKKIFQKGKRVCFENLVNSINTFDLKEAHINEIIMLIEVYDFKDNKTYLSTKTNSLFPEQVSNYFHNWIKTKNSISHFKSCLNIFKKSQLLSKLFYIEIPQLVDKIAKISDQNKINTLNKIKKEINKKYSEKLLLSSNTYMNVSFTRESFTSWLDKAINNMDTAMQPKDLVKIYTIYYFNNNRSLLKNKTRRLYFLNKLSFCLNRDSNKYKGVLKTISDEKETLK